MCSPEVLYNAFSSIFYLEENGIDGDIVEMGSWRGGGAAIMAEALSMLNSSRRLIVYDTFEGHPRPGHGEIDIWGNSMTEMYDNEILRAGNWVSADFEIVSTYLSEIHKNVLIFKELVDASSDFPDLNNIGMLKLDMNWYEPTVSALRSCCHRIVNGGLLILNDYGHHSGARAAADEFFKNKKPYFVHVNYSCIAAVVVK